MLVPTCPFLSVAQVNWGGRGVVCLLANGVCLILGKGRIGNIYPIRGRGTIQYTQDLQQDQDPSFISQDFQNHTRCTKDSKDLICCFVDRRMLSFTLRILRMLYAELRILRITYAVLRIVDHLCNTQDSLFHISPMKRVVSSYFL